MTARHTRTLLRSARPDVAGDLTRFPAHLSLSEQAALAMPAAPSGRSRVLLGVADQALSSVENLGFTLLGPVVLDTHELGRMTLVYSAYLLSLGIVRSVTSDVRVVTSLPRARRGVTPNERACVATSTAVAASLALVIAVVGLAVPALRYPFLLLAACFPLLATQDTLRYVAIARAEPAKALASDAVWTALAFISVAAVLWHGNSSVVALLLAWAGSGVVAGIVGLGIMKMPWQVLIPIRSRNVAEWLTRHRALYTMFAVDTVALQASGSLVLIEVSVLASVSEGGVLRAAQVLFTPLAFLISSARIVVVPELVRARLKGARLWRRRVAELCVVLTGVSVVWSLAVIFAPNRLLHAALGASTAVATALFVPVAITMITTFGITVPLFTAIRSLADGQSGLLARIPTAVALLIAAAIGSLLDGAHGAAWAMAFVSPLIVPLWGFATVRAVRRFRLADQN